MKAAESEVPAVQPLLAGCSDWAELNPVIALYVSAGLASVPPPPPPEHWACSSLPNLSQWTVFINHVIKITSGARLWLMHHATSQDPQWTGTLFSCVQTRDRHWSRLGVSQWSWCVIQLEDERLKCIMSLWEAEPVQPTGSQTCLQGLHKLKPEFNG